jgi:hypothetical protein
MPHPNGNPNTLGISLSVWFHLIQASIRQPRHRNLPPEAPSPFEPSHVGPELLHARFWTFTPVTQDPFEESMHYT